MEESDHLIVHLLLQSVVTTDVERLEDESIQGFNEDSSTEHRSVKQRGVFRHGTQLDSVSVEAPRTGEDPERH